MIIPAAVDIEARKCAVAVLPVGALGEATSLPEAVQPRVEADVSAAGPICARAFLILARADQLLIILGV